jgi:hypothetical protein
MTTVVFAGPSIHGLDPALLAGFTRHAPAACGDVLRAVGAGATIIGLIDGVFQDKASVWHKEILATLDRGVAVYGAASMGALRAAECQAFGMIGVGGIFEDYAAGRRVADADVAVAHAPEAFAFRPLTEAMVDVEAVLERLVAAATLSVETAQRLQAAATRLHFSQRDWPAILAEAGEAEQNRASILDAVRRLGFSRKRADALALLQRLRADSARGVAAGAAMPEPFNHTLFFAALERRLGIASR